MIENREQANGTNNGAPSLKDRVRELQLTNRLEGAKANRNRSSTSWLPWILCILLSVTWSGIAIRWYRTSTSMATPAPFTTKAAGESDAKGNLSASQEVALVSKGYLIPSQSIPISPIDVAGRVIEINIEEGQKVPRGKKLAVIDSTRFVAEYKEADAQLAASEARYTEQLTSWEFEKRQAEAELKEGKAQLDKDELEYQIAASTLSAAVARLELGQLKKKVDASKEHLSVLNIKNELMRGKPREQRIKALLRDMEAAEARKNKAQWALDNCIIKAPITGIILTKKAELGSLINPVVGGVSTTLCEMADLSKLEVDLEILERDIALLSKGMSCSVRADAYPERIYKGYVERLMPVANRARGIIPVRVRVLIPPEEEQGQYLRPDMGVVVTFYKKSPEQVGTFNGSQSAGNQQPLSGETRHEQ